MSLNIIVLISQALVFSLHASLQLAIYTAKLKENKFYLIRALSLTDASNSVFILVTVLGRQGSIDWMEAGLAIRIGFGISLWLHHMSLFITMLIVVDRWIAIRYCLEYPTIVTKRRLRCMIGCVSLIDAFILTVCFAIRLDKRRPLFFAKLATGIFHFSTCAVIISLGKITMKIRNRTVADIRKQSTIAVHGRTAESLSVLQTLTKSLRDVNRFNFLTCIFLMPLVIIPLTVDFDKKKDGSNALFLSTAVYHLSNPVIYITVFRRIRREFYRFISEICFKLNMTTR